MYKNIPNPSEIHEFTTKVAENEKAAAVLANTVEDTTQTPTPLPSPPSLPPAVVTMEFNDNNNVIDIFPPTPPESSDASASLVESSSSAASSSSISPLPAPVDEIVSEDPIVEKLSNDIIKSQHLSSVCSEAVDENDMNTYDVSVVKEERLEMELEKAEIALEESGGPHLHRHHNFPTNSDLLKEDQMVSYPSMESDSNSDSNSNSNSDSNSDSDSHVSDKGSPETIILDATESSKKEENSCQTEAKSLPLLLASSSAATGTPCTEEEEESSTCLALVVVESTGSGDNPSESLELASEKEKKNLNVDETAASLPKVVVIENKDEITDSMVTLPPPPKSPEESERDSLLPDFHTYFVNHDGSVDEIPPSLDTTSATNAVDDSALTYHRSWRGMCICHLPNHR